MTNMASFQRLELKNKLVCQCGKHVIADSARDYWKKNFAKLNHCPIKKKEDKQKLKRDMLIKDMLAKGFTLDYINAVHPPGPKQT